MLKSLIIVESPTKAKTISRILGKQYSVSATVGHIVDLPKERLGVDIDNGFKPQYRKIKGKAKVIKDICKAAENSNRILIATDPDREGEAIAFHIYNEINTDNKEIKRVLFHEITAKAVAAAIEKSTEIDFQKVEAQQARRILDRLVGYLVSPILWKTIAKGLSAGRVQSVALRLICEREDEISVFKPEEYWTIDADLNTLGNERFIARCDKYQGKKLDIPNNSEADDHLARLKEAEYILADRKKKKTKRSPKPPFTTSTLQQEAGKRLRYSSKRTMVIAQQLYEGIELGDEGPTGLITYMRTDSVRSAPEAIQSARDYIADTYGTEYLPRKPRLFASKGRTQDAHEAIRPTNLKLSPGSLKKYLSPPQLQLYTLIYNRFISSQMADAVFEQTTLLIKAGEYQFKTTGSIPVFRGFLAVWQETADSGDEDGANSKLPVKTAVGERLELIELLPDQHFTEPPPRFTESSLVKTLDELGIGRPSTYATIISVLFDRKYIDRKERSLIPTELGQTVKTILINNLAEIFSVGFTAEMENRLDDIEAGDLKWNAVIDDFYRPFSASLEIIKSKKDEIKESIQEKTGEVCEKCGGEMIIKWGRNGKFMACSNFPDCRNTKPLEAEQPQQSGKKCPKCGNDLLLKNGRFGQFLGCQSYPECKHIEPVDLGIPCPKEECTGKISERKSRKGKLFYGCTNYPKCDFVSWYKPVIEKCPDCGHPFLELRQRKAGDVKKCPKCKLELKQDE